MQELTISFLNMEQGEISVAALALHMNTLEKQMVSFAPWPAYSYKPNVSFSIAYGTACIYLKYFVDEKRIRAAAGHSNGKVWEDSCVEFFISFDDAGYYNLEFNCIGTGLIGFGKEGKDRRLVPEEVIRKIKVCVLITKENEDNIHWELTLKIPLEVFTFHHLTSLKGRKCTANFYKCGDGLDEPHYLAWSNIIAPEPNFHLPQYFGTLYFEE